MSERIKMRTFRCINCGNTTDVHPDHVDDWLKEYLNENSGHIHCEIEGCDDGVLGEVSEGTGITLYLNLYAIHDSYGGPEEGGWYYESGEARGSIPLPATWQWTGDIHDRDVLALRPRIEPKHLDAARTLLKLTASDDPKNFRITEEPCMAVDYPRHRPHYE